MVRPSQQQVTSRALCRCATFCKLRYRTLLDKTLNGDESMCFGATMCSPKPFYLNRCSSSLDHSGMPPRFLPTSNSISVCTTTICSASGMILILVPFRASTAQCTPIIGSCTSHLSVLSAHYKQLDSSSDAAFKPEKSVPLFPRRSKLPSTKRVTLKTISDTIVSLSHDAQSDLPSNSVTVLERFNVTGASGAVSCSHAPLVSSDRVLQV